jgi:hypothetical protein
MLLRRRRPARRGAVLVEAAIVLSVFLVLVLGMLDLGVGVFRHNTLSQAARHGARRAAVHGVKCLPGYEGGPWGTGKVGPVAASASSHPILAQIRPMLVGCDLDETQVEVEWPDASNDVEKRVRVTVTTSYQPVLTSFFGADPVTLRAASTIPIAH